MIIVYMGTPEFAVPPLKKIIEAGYEVAAVFTQPDKPKGRSGKPSPSPVKEAALEAGLTIYQPERLRDEENVKLLQDINPDMIVVAAYGQILPESILNIPKYGCINIHASLLPKYRGAAPIERSILDGETVTGVTTMYMAKGLDTGDIIEQVSTDIDRNDTGASLRERLSHMGAELIISTMKKLEDGTAERTVQDDSKSNYAKMLSKEMGIIDFNKSSDEIERQIRALNPWPMSYTKIAGKTAKIYLADSISSEELASDFPETAASVHSPGEIIVVTRKSFVIACGEGALRIRRLQPEGKKEMDAASYLNGNRLTVGMKAEF